MNEADELFTIEKHARASGLAKPDVFDVLEMLDDGAGDVLDDFFGNLADQPIDQCLRM